MLGLVPARRRTERPVGGSPIVWNTFHLARHAALALEILGPGGAPPAPIWLPGQAGLTASAAASAGLEEAPAQWADALLTADVDAYLAQATSAAMSARCSPRETGWDSARTEDNPAAHGGLCSAAAPGHRDQSGEDGTPPAPQWIVLAAGHDTPFLRW